MGTPPEEQDTLLAVGATVESDSVVVIHQGMQLGGYPGEGLIPDAARPGSGDRLGGGDLAVGSSGWAAVLCAKELNSSHPIVQAIGVEATQKLTQHYCRETLSLPTGVAVLQAIKRRGVIADAGTGMSREEIARQ
ncbi:hypothetical protein DO97_18900 [Neosynechococcus sphagnicola sy1]|uniref:Uncharacterized protein n=1 Tax=Neosynechococcus sphagnicola sy1 TaxID=1497020 RepID=A0A098TMK5_9CYAN|nr:hypothetical protein [Neosynechococcus sphagnicola]KGF73555.1 hypothetical protein DO97_18900 [Neosynechococcus sphagnicola sy1]